MPFLNTLVRVATSDVSLVSGYETKYEDKRCRMNRAVPSTPYVDKQRVGKSALDPDCNQSDMNMDKEEEFGAAPQSPPPVTGWVGPFFQSFKSKMASFTEIVMSPVKLFIPSENVPPPSIAPDSPKQLDSDRDLNGEHLEYMETFNLSSQLGKKDGTIDEGSKAGTYPELPQSQGLDEEAAAGDRCKSLGSNQGGLGHWQGEHSETGGRIGEHHTAIQKCSDYVNKCRYNILKTHSLPEEYKCTFEGSQPSNAVLALDEQNDTTLLTMTEKETNNNTPAPYMLHGQSVTSSFEQISESTQFASSSPLSNTGASCGSKLNPDVEMAERVTLTGTPGRPPLRRKRVCHHKSKSKSSSSNAPPFETLCNCTTHLSSTDILTALGIPELNGEQLALNYTQTQICHTSDNDTSSTLSSSGYYTPPVSLCLAVDNGERDGGLHKNKGILVSHPSPLTPLRKSARKAATVRDATLMAAASPVSLQKQLFKSEGKRNVVVSTRGKRTLKPSALVVIEKDYEKRKKEMRRGEKLEEVGEKESLLVARSESSTLALLEHKKHVGLRNSSNRPTQSYSRTAVDVKAIPEPVEMSVPVIEGLRKKGSGQKGCGKQNTSLTVRATPSALEPGDPTVAVDVKAIQETVEMSTPVIEGLREKGSGRKGRGKQNTSLTVRATPSALEPGDSTVAVDVKAIQETVEMGTPVIKGLREKGSGRKGRGNQNTSLTVRATPSALEPGDSTVAVDVKAIQETVEMSTPVIKGLREKGSGRKGRGKQNTSLTVRETPSALEPGDPTVTVNVKAIQEPVEITTPVIEGLREKGSGRKGRGKQNTESLTVRETPSVHEPEDPTVNHNNSSLSEGNSRGIRKRNKMSDGQDCFSSIKRVKEKNMSCSSHSESDSNAAGDMELETTMTTSIAKASLEEQTGGLVQHLDTKGLLRTSTIPKKGALKKRKVHDVGPFQNLSKCLKVGLNVPSLIEHDGSMSSPSGAYPEQPIQLNEYKVNNQGNGSEERVEEVFSNNDQNQTVDEVMEEEHGKEEKNTELFGTTEVAEISPCTRVLRRKLSRAAENQKMRRRAMCRSSRVKEEDEEEAKHGVPGEQLDRVGLVYSDDSTLTGNLQRSHSCPEMRSHHDSPWNMSLLSPHRDRALTPQPRHHSSFVRPATHLPKSFRRTRRHTVCSMELDRGIAPLCLRKEVYPTRRSSSPYRSNADHPSPTILPSPTSFSAQAFYFLSSPLAFLSKKADKRGAAANGSPVASSSSSGVLPSSSSPSYSPVWSPYAGSHPCSPPMSDTPSAPAISPCSGMSQIGNGEDGSSFSQEFESMVVVLREEKALSDSEIKMGSGKHEERGKVSSIRIRKGLPKAQNNLTPMGLPKVVRLKKKEFSLEEIYTNKNFTKPPEGRLEAIFEVPRNLRNGSQSLTGLKRIKRYVEFPELGVARKPRKPLVGPGKAGNAPIGRPRRGAYPNSKDGPSISSEELDSLLCSKLDQLDNWLAFDQETA